MAFLLYRKCNLNKWKYRLKTVFFAFESAYWLAHHLDLNASHTRRLICLIYAANLLTFTDAGRTSSLAITGNTVFVLNFVLRLVAYSFKRPSFFSASFLCSSVTPLGVIFTLTQGGLGSFEGF